MERYRYKSDLEDYGNRLTEQSQKFEQTLNALNNTEKRLTAADLVRLKLEKEQREFQVEIISGGKMDARVVKKSVKLDPRTPVFSSNDDFIKFSKFPS